MVHATPSIIVEESKKMSEDLMLERLRRMDHKLDGLIEDVRGIRLDVQEIKTRIALIERGYAPNSQSFDRLLAFVEREDVRIRTIESRLSALERA